MKESTTGTAAGRWAEALTSWADAPQQQLRQITVSSDGTADGSTGG